MTGGLQRGLKCRRTESIGHGPSRPCVALFFRPFKFASVYIARLIARLTIERGINARLGLFFACLRLNIRLLCSSDA